MSRIEAVPVEGTFTIREKPPDPADRFEFVGVANFIAVEESNQAVAVHRRTLASDASFALRNRDRPRTR